MVCQELIEPRAIPISKSEFIGISLIVKELSTYENSEGRELVKITFVIVLVVLFVIVIVYSTTSFKETIVGIEVILIVGFTIIDDENNLFILLSVEAKTTLGLVPTS